MLNIDNTADPLQPIQEAPQGDIPHVCEDDERALLSKKISDLQLKIEGSALEPFIKKLHEEVQAKGISYFPPCYLADEWGCPDGIPAVAIPFYLVDKKLTRLEMKHVKEIEKNDDEEIMRILRHEMGHVVNYAYALYKTPEWKKLFGGFSRPYRDNYRPNPFSKKYVKHLDNWYAQKHPDDDFAETFAIWLTPHATWRESYKGWGALKKLEYVDRVMGQIKDQPPVVYPDLNKEMLVKDIDMTLSDYFKKKIRQYQDEYPDRFDNDLKEIFRQADGGKPAEPAAEFLKKHQKYLTELISHWTGENKYVIKTIFGTFIKRSRDLGLPAARDAEERLLRELGVLITTLAMNYYHKHKF